MKRFKQFLSEGNYFDDLIKTMQVTYEANPSKPNLIELGMAKMGNISNVANALKDLGVSPVLDAEGAKLAKIPVVGEKMADIVSSEPVKRILTHMGMRSQFPKAYAKQDAAFAARLKELENDPSVSASQLAIELDKTKNPDLRISWNPEAPNVKSVRTQIQDFVNKSNEMTRQERDDAAEKIVGQIQRTKPKR